MVRQTASTATQFAITADQIESRENPDLVGDALEHLNAGRHSLTLPAERTVGDELQLLTPSPSDALAVILHLTRDGHWSVGCGIGPVRAPLPPSVREASGGALIAARDAVERAKKSPTRFALTHSTGVTLARDTEALIDLLLALRARRSDEGWQVHDLLDTGGTQAEAAAALGISPQAVSDRARAADLRVESAARAPLVRLLSTLASVEP